MNRIIDITFYLLTQFVEKYLRKYQSKLAHNKIDTHVELEQSILCGNTIKSDDIVERQEGFCSRTARK